MLQAYENSQDEELDGHCSSHYDRSFPGLGPQPEAMEEFVDKRYGRWSFREDDSWTAGSDSFEVNCNVGADFNHQGQRGLVPRRFGAKSTRDMSEYIPRDNRAISMGLDSQHLRVGRHSFTVPWLQDTTQKFRRTETWCPQSLVRNIDESEAQDMCSTIERGIISDSVTLPPELLSP